MAITHFPPLETADESGLIGVGGDLEISSLLLAYKSGIFPWPISKEYPLAWFSPDPRGVLLTAEVHLSSSFKKFLKKNNYVIKFNTRFSAVILNCAKMTRPHETSTWITEEIINAYIELFKAKLAYSVEVYEDASEERLIGGLYGVKIHHYVSGESMFHIKSNASKLALYALMLKLKSEGIEMLDTQMVTPVVESFGGRYIPRKDFIKRLQPLF